MNCRVPQILVQEGNGPFVGNLLERALKWGATVNTFGYETVPVAASPVTDNAIGRSLKLCPEL